MEEKKVKVYCAVPTTGTVADAQTYFWRETEKRYGNKVEFIWPEACVRRVFHDFARNAHVEDFLKSGADILFFLDSDVVPPNDLFDLVLDHEKWSLAGAPYPVFMTPAGVDRPQLVFTAYKGRAGHGLGAADIPKEGKEFIDGLATGCMFIKREVFDKLAKPYFEFTYEAESRKMVEGEDLGFCRKVNDQGFKFYVDFSKVCKHYKNVCLLDMSNYAVEYAKRSLEMYSALIKPLVEQLSARAREKSKGEPSKIHKTGAIEQLRRQGIIKV
jgi:hypothetical protein